MESMRLSSTAIFFYRLQLWPRQYFYTCLSFCSQGVLSASVHDGIPHPRDQNTPQGQTPPGTRYTPRTKYTPGTKYTPRTKYTPTWDLVHPPGLSTPSGTRYTPMGSRLRHTVNARPVRILLECILVWLIFTGPLRQHPTPRPGSATVIKECYCWGITYKWNDTYRYQCQGRLWFLGSIHTSELFTK